ncbi:MAG: YchF-related putative GTPase [Candidatus Micrarchaeota archaeon]|nr:YchF-related putative GTPase [Candidatus Micrarchaeota archaeon]
MLIGIVGAPNKGKSTLFSALTLNDVGIADYPFTTIDPNKGITYATSKCPETELGTRCGARNSLCQNGIRHIPVNVVDVAGLVEGAHLGKGMGNQFLNDLAASDALMLVVDASGKTDPGGNPCESCDASPEIRMVKGEIADWIASIVKRHMPQISRRQDGINALSEALTGLKVNRDEIKFAIESNGIADARISWSDEDTKKFADKLLEISKPMLIVANKCDVKGSEGEVSILKSSFGEANVVAVSAAIELALRKAEKQHMIERAPGSKEIKILSPSMTKEQTDALGYMQDFIRKSDASAQGLVNHVVFNLLDDIVVYPVEDENKYTDHFGNVLPDALLMRKGSTALDLAARIHTDIAKNMLYAVDARSKMRLGKDYELKHNDVIRIVSAAR